MIEWEIGFCPACDCWFAVAGARTVKMNRLKRELVLMGDLGEVLSAIYLEELNPNARRDRERLARQAVHSSGEGQGKER